MGVGSSLGAIYSSFTQLSTIEKLFKVIKKQILDFSEKHPIEKSNLPEPEKISNEENSQESEDLCKEDNLLKAEAPRENDGDKKYKKNYELIMKILFLPGVWLLENVDYKLLDSKQNTLNLFIDHWFDLIIFYLTESKETWDRLEQIISINIKNKLQELSESEFLPIYKNMKEFAILISIEWDKGLSFVPYLIEIQGILISQLNGKKFFTTPPKNLN